MSDPPPRFSRGASRSGGGDAIRPRGARSHHAGCGHRRGRFIGHHLVGGLLWSGHEVIVIDGFSTGDRERPYHFGGDIAVTGGTILDSGTLAAAFAGCEVVLHEAPIASVSRSPADPRATNAVNVSATIEVLLAAARRGVRRFVFVSSSAVCGVLAELPAARASGLIPSPVPLAAEPALGFASARKCLREPQRS